MALLQRFFASRRRRRRAFWLACLAAAGGTVAALVVWVGDTGDQKEVFTNEPASVYTEPKDVAYSKRELARIHETAVLFIKTAVARDHIADSWSITHPELKVGYTRESWAKGNIPAVPYPAEAPEAAPWRVAYSYRNDIDLYMALLPKKGAQVRAMAFSVELKAVGSGEGRRWLVSSWVPLGGGSVDAAQQVGGSERQTGAATVTRAPLSSVWLFVPLGLLGAILLIPITIGVREWVRGRRVRKAFLPGRSPFEP